MNFGFLKVTTAQRRKEERVCLYCDSPIEGGELVAYLVSGKKNQETEKIARFTHRIHHRCLQDYTETAIARTSAKRLERISSGEVRLGRKSHGWTPEQIKNRNRLIRKLYDARGALDAAYGKSGGGRHDLIHNGWKKVIRTLKEIDPELHGTPPPMFILGEDLADHVLQNDTRLYNLFLDTGTPEEMVEALMNYYKFPDLDPVLHPSNKSYRPPAQYDEDLSDIPGTDEYYLKWQGGVREDGSVVEISGV